MKEWLPCVDAAGGPNAKVGVFLALAKEDESQAWVRLYAFVDGSWEVSFNNEYTIESGLVAGGNSERERIDDAKRAACHWAASVFVDWAAFALEGSTHR